ncbi:MAG: hypothetical protein CVT94_07380 [Bacteroidetes bacterium HGW-Bacteroidetes-11]|jgi:hypothetical protein|nr:MAG: hypothetical protein CVT94_07380 [Bacteroidetes bacterium HGW-Bacteroidetes-11]
MPLPFVKCRGIFFTFGANLFIPKIFLMKSRLLLFIVLALLPAFNALADIVDRESAAMVARNFFYERQVQSGVNTDMDAVVPVWLSTKMASDQPVYHVFNFQDGGYVIVSAEDAYSPVIGYSPDGYFPAGSLEQNFGSFLKGYEDQIVFIRDNNTSQTSEIKNSWQYYTSMSTTRMSFTGGRDMEPLLPVLWNQDFPYNAYCPLDAAGPGGHVYAGCVATAMSMIMNYYRYPEHGTGSYSYNYGSYGNISANFGQTYYDWDAMLNSITSGSGRAVNAIAELQYQCGVSVRMMYGPDGSGAYSEDVPYALRTYFGYSSTVQHVRKSNYSSTAWENMIIASLDELKPLYYSGQSTDGGHAFVLDGYEVTGTGKLFHFNFGWSGSGNGFYTLSDVNGFSSGQAMVRNFFPNPANYPYNCNNHVITSPMGIFEDRSGPLSNYLSNKSCSWLIAPEDSVTSISLTFNSFDLAEGDAVNVYDGADVSAPLIASYSMNAATTVLTSTGSRMFIEFLTDGANEAKGFIAQFNSTYPVFCSGTITMTEPTGTITDGSGEHRYNHNSMCKWKIEPGPYADNLTLAFTSFDLEENKDYLKVYALPTNQLIANFTGSTIPEPLVSPTGRMLILFTSNGFNNKGGFDAEYYIMNVSASAKEFTGNLSVYPNPAKTHTEVKFNIAEATKAVFGLYDLTGREVYQETATLNSGFNSKVLQLSNLKSGVYLLRISSEKGIVSRKLIIE